MCNCKSFAIIRIDVHQRINLWHQFSFSLKYVSRVTNIPRSDLYQFYKPSTASARRLSCYPFMNPTSTHSVAGAAIATGSIELILTLQIDDLLTTFLNSQFLNTNLISCSVQGSSPMSNSHTSIKSSSQTVLPRGCRFIPQLPRAHAVYHRKYPLKWKIFTARTCPVPFLNYGFRKC